MRESSILAGVPRIGYDTGYCTFAGALRAVMEYLGTPVDYDHLMGVTGLCFRMLWNRDDPGNVGPMHFADQVVPRAFRALGYEHYMVSYTRGEAALLDALDASLERGRPVLASGIVGPPECEIVAGYSEQGRVLHGWSYFQDHAAPGYYAQPEWYDRASWGNDLGFIIVGERHPNTVPAARDLLGSSLRWALDLERTPDWPSIPDHTSGLAAFAAWADALEVDEDYPQDAADTVELRHTVQCDAATMVVERHHAARFLRQMTAVDEAAAPHLRVAADLYERVGDAAGPIYPWGRDWARPDLVDRQVRRQIAGHVRRAAGLESEAVACLQAALCALGADAGPRICPDAGAGRAR